MQRGGRYQRAFLVKDRAGAGGSNAAENTAANTETNTVEPQLAEDKAHTAINGMEFALDKETSYNGLGYTVSESFKEVEQPMCVQYNYSMEDGSNLFFFRVFYYKTGGIDAAGVNRTGENKPRKLETSSLSGF